MNTKLVADVIWLSTRKKSPVAGPSVNRLAHDRNENNLTLSMKSWILYLIKENYSLIELINSLLPLANKIFAILRITILSF